MSLMDIHSAPAHSGSPADFAEQTTETFSDTKKIIKISTPGIEGFSKIYPAFLETDRRYFYVPCPRCGYSQRFEFSQLKFPDKIPENCYYECFQCKAKLTEKDKFPMINGGFWKKTFPERIHKPGFHLNRLYSVFYSMVPNSEGFFNSNKKTNCRGFRSYASFYKLLFSFNLEPEQTTPVKIRNVETC